MELVSWPSSRACRQSLHGPGDRGAHVTDLPASWPRVTSPPTPQPWQHPKHPQPLAGPQLGATGLQCEGTDFGFASLRNNDIKTRAQGWGSGCLGSKATSPPPPQLPHGVTWAGFITSPSLQFPWLVEGRPYLPRSRL